MNNFSHSTKYQEQEGSDEYTSNYAPRHAGRTTCKTYANKHTNTPLEFMTCTKCNEKLSRKFQQTGSCAVGDCERSMTEYSKALNYINSCHTLINQMMKQLKYSSEFIKMPDLPNFVDLFYTLTSFQNTSSVDKSKPLNKKPHHESRYNTHLFEDKSRNNSKEKSQRSSSPIKAYHPTRQQNREGQIKQTTKGKFIELLPDVQQTGNYKDQDGLTVGSPGTTESEDSDLEFNLRQKSGRIVMTNKYKSKMRTTQHEKVIYEEDSLDDDSINTYKKEDEPINQKNKDVNSNTGCKRTTTSVEHHARPCQSSLTTSRMKSVVSNSLPTNTIRGSAAASAENSKIINNKPKQRSSSSVTPREKLKVSGVRKGTSEVTGNYSDTAIMAGSIEGQIKKFAPKTLSTPIDMRNNEITQQELDKYAKELLGSDSPSPRSKSPSVHPTQVSSTGKVKIEDNKTKRYQKTSASPPLRLRLPEPKNKKPSSQERQSPCVNTHVTSSKIRLDSNNAQNSHNVQHQNQEQQQSQNHQNIQQCNKKYRKSFDAQQQLLEQNVMKKQPNSSSGRKSAAASYGSGSTVMTGGANQNNKISGFAFGNVIPQDFNERNYEVGRNDSNKNKNSDPSHRYEDDENVQKAPSVGEELEEGNCMPGDRVNLLCDNTETMNLHLKPIQKRVDMKMDLNSKPKVQYAVKSKPNDFFTDNRKNISLRERRVQREIEYEINVESDDIKTDSDIEEDHFDRDEVSLSRKSSKSGAAMQISEVLTHLGLLPNSQLPTETEQRMNEAKCTRANDERNRPFREPRKSNEDSSERIVKLEETRTRDVYTAETLNQLRRTPSEDSSDIKSDEELYNVNSNSKNAVTFNYCLEAGRYQT